MLEFFDGNYAKSIRHFYDVKGMYDGLIMNRFLTGQMLFTNSYIALFYYEFEDYDTAIRVLSDNIAVPVDDPILNAERKYPDYINLSGTYLKLKDAKNAIRVCKEFEEIVPYIPEDIRDSVRAYIYDNYAIAATIEGDYNKAQEYVDKAFELSQNSESEAFYGGDAFFKTSQARLYAAKGDYNKAKQLLEGVLADGSAEYAGNEGDVYDLLLEVYNSLGDSKSYYDTIDLINESQAEFYHTLKREYMELSQYYEKSEILTRQNEALQSNKRIFFFIIGIIVMALIFAIIAAFYVNRATYFDQLTGIKNRKALHAYAKKHASFGIALNTCIIMMDIDHFKQYNDTYGHLYGDSALRQVAQAIKESVRKNDFLIRYGGEEYLLILENITFERATEIANKILSEVQRKGIEHKSSPVSDVITVSLGMYINKEAGSDLEQALSRADEALYEAKSLGRNRISIWKE